MKKIINVIRWIVVTIFAIMALGAIIEGVFVGALLFLLGGAIIAPLSIISKVRSKLKLNKAISIVLAIVLFFAGALTLPTTPETNETDESTSITETASDEKSEAEITDSSPEETTGIPEDTTEVPEDTDNAEAEPETETDTDTDTNKVTDTATDKVTDKVTEKETVKETEAETEAPALSVGAGKAKPANPSKLPAYSGKAYTEVDGNIPNFSSAELAVKSYEKYSDLDSLGRCTVTIASIGRDLMPTEDRGSIGSVKPTGWHTVKYDTVDGKYLYNRCHLIGFQLTGENANVKNLITGTRYMNVDGMLPFENMVADYIKETGNHVAYRATPIFEGSNLLASGVQIEAYSIEDEGDGICFNVYCYNVQPGITINYADGSSSLDADSTEDTDKTNETEAVSVTYVLNTSTKKFHYPSCYSAKKIAEKNYAESSLSRSELIANGYDPCGNCKP